jgi:cytochrome c-type biogenesis protein CcmE
MNSSRAKFVIGGGIIVAALVWQGFVGFQESKAYYITVEEYSALKDTLQGKTLKIAGDVVSGSIDRTNPQMEFVMGQNGKTLRVRYIGKEVIPDTFRDGAKAVVEGSIAPDGVLHARSIEAKCASKYEAEYERRRT